MTILKYFDLNRLLEKNYINQICNSITNLSDD